MTTKSSRVGARSADAAPHATPPSATRRMAHRADERDRSATIAWLLLAIAGIAGFVVLTGLMLARAPMPFDKPLLDLAAGLPVDAFVWRVISESANIPLVVIGVGIVVLLLVRGQRRDAVLVALLLIAVTAGSEGVKQLVARPRPSGTDPNIPGVVFSYPSGHVLEALVIFGIIAIHLVRSRAPRVLAWLFVVLVLVDVVLVGTARVALTAHYPSDVLASILAGAGVLALYALLTRGWNQPGRPIRAP